MSITRFRGKYRFLSNFWNSKIVIDGIIYQSVEHYYQSSKFIDIFLRKKIIYSPSPGMAKKLARKFKNFVRDDWEQISLDIMYKGVKAKFSQNSNLRVLLLETNDLELIEGNTWNDRFWGVDINTGEGCNHLGKIIMKVREELRNKC